MILIIKKKSFYKIATLIGLAISLVVLIVIFSVRESGRDNSRVNFIYELVEEPSGSPSPSPSPEKTFIKWVEFKVSYLALEHALKYDIDSYEQPVKINWVDLLSYLGAKYGGEFRRYKAKDMKDLVDRLNAGEIMNEITKDMKYYKYYREAYSAILDGMVGEYQVQVPDPNNSEEKIWKKVYGLKAFSPIARGFGYGDYDDFGNSRNYGYKRRHLGHDMMGGIGTPIIAMESGIVEAAGWNKYGGWRIGIRSFDRRRYYYYAHMRKNWPFHKSIKEGEVVNAGDVIGYLGMTGYSNKENVNGIRQPHLHFGLQLIFDESQKECINEIWIDVYNLTKLLQKNRSAVNKDPETKDYYRLYQIQDPAVLIYNQLHNKQAE